MATLSVSVLSLYDKEGEEEAARCMGILFMFSFDELCLIMVG